MQIQGARLIVVVLVIACLVVPSAIAVDSADSNPSGDDLAMHSVGPWGLDTGDRDPSVKSGDDFYMSQNGAWFNRITFTPERPYAAYWNDLRRMVPRRLSGILAEVSANENVKPESVEGRAGAFYRAYMDEKTAEAKGVTPLKPQLDQIRAAHSKDQLAELMGVVAGPWTTRTTMSRNQPPNRSLFGINIGQDQSATDRYAVYIGQAGIGMPGPEYYLDPHLADIKAEYLRYVTRVLTAIGWPNPEVEAKAVVALEGRIAEVSWSHEQMLDPLKTHNPTTIAKLSKLAPEFNWRKFLAGAGLDKVNNVVIDAKDAFPKIARIFAETPADVMQAQQAFVLVDNAGLQLNSEVFQANFDFWGKMFNNQTASPRPRWFYAWNTLEDNIGDLLGVLYVHRYFSPEAKGIAVEMANNMKVAFDSRLQKTPWMSESTKAKAREKLANMTMNIGYPDKIQDYSGLVISDTDLYGDVTRTTAFKWHDQVKRLHSKFDPSFWQFSPQWVSYTYTPTTNTLEIPAGSFQPPFFDIKADPAINYGSVGVMIGAMMASAFDNVGRHYDPNGRLHDWWTADEARTFENKVRQLSEEYSAIEPLPGIHVKGELVVNEAIDDLTGWLIALDAYHLSLKGQPAPVLDGFTGDQRVFLGRAQMWRAKFPPDFVRNQLATGRNAMPFLRVNGPVRNIDTWYEAFDVQPGQEMYVPPDQRVHIW